jgi:hypothetical protein
MIQSDHQSRALSSSKADENNRQNQVDEALPSWEWKQVSIGLPKRSPASPYFSR